VKFVAVTSCPTGIAHTYMAAESLSEEGKRRGHDIAVETQGSTGIEDAIKEDQIREADAVIIAADAKVAKRERFEGLPVVEVSPGQAINKPGEVFDQAERAAESGKGVETAAAVAATAGAGGRGTDADAASASDAGSTPAGGAGGGGGGGPKTSSKGGAVRQWLMTGVSYMIPFVVAGGILIALAFLIGDTIDVVDANVYEEFTFPALLMEIGGTAFSMLVPILAGFIAYGMADRPALAPGVVGGLIAVDIEAGFLGGLAAGLLAGGIVMALKKLPVPRSLKGLMPVLVLPLLGTFAVGAIMILLLGEPIAAFEAALTDFLEGLEGANIIFLGIILGAMMAVDMGGPINKVAYTFGIGAVAAGLLQPMAAVMAAGMTPPLGLALATVVGKRYFSADEREAGKANWVMGASFITEGAIPFAAADPIRVIPSLIVGSATAGGLAMAFGNALPAPHGGIFVVGLVEGWPLYLLAILIGTVVTAAMVLGLKSIGASDSEVTPDKETVDA
jgi:fructose PTS system EIIBC or EIIC component